MWNVKKQEIKCDFDKSEHEKEKLLLRQPPEMRKGKRENQEGRRINMENSLVRKWWENYRNNLYYAVCIMLAGTLFHFVYDWSGHNAFVALFSPVNESVWEHLKLFFIPAFFFTIIEDDWVREKQPDYLWCQTKSIVAGILFIIVMYFTYLGITRRGCTWIDIGIFYLSAVIAGVVSGTCRLKKCNNEIRYRRYAYVILLLLWILFVWFTYQIPKPLMKWMPGLFVSEA